MEYTAPIMNCRESAKFEEAFFADDARAESEAILRAGSGVADEFLKEFRLGENPRIFVLAGDGHNGADALVVAAKICARYPCARLSVAVSEHSKLKPNTAKAFESLMLTCSAQIERVLRRDEIAELRGDFDLMIEGLVGMTFKAPARPSLIAEIEAANALNAHIKISIDIPAGASDTAQTPIFRADTTYATGIAKDVLFKTYNRQFVGRIRFVDIGFFDKNCDAQNSKNFILSPTILNPLKKLRPSLSDKRGYGHIFVLAGSRNYAGAALMNVKAALRSGAGLVTAFVPEIFAPQFAAVEPSAIWVGCPEQESGAIAYESYSEIRARISRATAFLAGSGLTDSAETCALVGDVLKNFSELPAVLDADAVSKKIAESLPYRRAETLLTPHEGEFLRLAADASDESLLETCKKYRCSILLKSSATRGCDGNSICYSTRGSPALSRAGSGDLLAGLCAGIAASRKFKSLLSSGLCACEWLGRSAESAAKELSETAMATSDIPCFFPVALR